MQPIIDNFRYRPEVDGLRAIAVLAVVFFHSGLGLPGGYIGVDVFFVISGYLITSLIINDLQRGKFTIVGFWERRARRIIPALAALVPAILIAGWFILLPKEYAALGKSAAWQSVFGANFYFWMVTVNGYFAGAADEMPLLHTWSLAVEEQFYMIVPLALAAVFRFPPLRTRRVLLTLFATGICAGLLISVYGVAYHRSAAFYLLPTRAWELLLGSALAILPPACMVRNRGIREILSYLGLAAIVIPCFYYTGKTAFPGLAAIPPCLGTALIVWASNQYEQDIPHTTLGSFLAIRPVVFVGLISYSLYLWHWPIIAFTRYYFGGEAFSLGLKTILILVAFVLAAISWRFVETPFRQKNMCASRRDIFCFASAVLVTSFALSLLVHSFHGVPQRFPANLLSAITWDADAVRFFKQLSIEDIEEDRLLHLGVRDTNQPIQVLVWGDSHAMTALPAFDAVLRNHRISGRAATHTATAPVCGRVFHSSGLGLGPEAARFNEEVFSYVEKNHIPHVVLIAQWAGYNITNAVSVQPTPIINSTAPLETALLATANRLASIGTQAWIFLQVPSHPSDVSKVLRQHRTKAMQLNQPVFCGKPNHENGLGTTNAVLLVELKRAGARIIDPRPAFLSANKDLYLLSLDDVILYRDSHHLTKAGVEKILIPVLQQSFLPYL